MSHTGEDADEEGQDPEELPNDDYDEPPIQTAPIDMDDLLHDDDTEEKADNEEAIDHMDSGEEDNGHEEDSDDDGVESDPEDDEDVVGYGDM
jgi:hypothetical protein